MHGEYSEIRVGRVSLFVSAVHSVPRTWYCHLVITGMVRYVLFGVAERQLTFTTSYHSFVNDYRTTQDRNRNGGKVYWILLTSGRNKK